MAMVGISCACHVRHLTLASVPCPKGASGQWGSNIECDMWRVVEPTWNLEVQAYRIPLQLATEDGENLEEVYMGG